MQSAFNEVYVIDRSSMRYLQANEAARTNLNYSVKALNKMFLSDIAPGLDAVFLKQVLKPIDEGKRKNVVLKTTHIRKDGSTYPIKLRFFQVENEGHEEVKALIAVGYDISDHENLTRSLELSEVRFRAMVSNAPGLVYQFQQRKDGSLAYLYLSEHCHALLGIDEVALTQDPTRFNSLILPEDLPSYIESMRKSAVEMSAWNWEGRISVDGWEDVKWINVRSKPRLLENGDLQWDGIMTNITQSKEQQAEMARSRQQLAELTSHVQNVKEQVQARIAREIHDDLGGNLTAIKMALTSLSQQNSTTEENKALEQKISYVNALVDRTFEAAHRISRDLRPSILDLGIVEAINWQAREFEKQVGIPCDVTSNVEEIDLSAEHAIAMFRIFQETLTNVGKHAQANQVTVQLTQEDRKVRLVISDDGRGLTKKDRLKPNSFGLRGMSERASALGGELSITSGARGGTTVTFNISL